MLWTETGVHLTENNPSINFRSKRNAYRRILTARMDVGPLGKAYSGRWGLRLFDRPMLTTKQKLIATLNDEVVLRPGTDGLHTHPDLPGVELTVMDCVNAGNVVRELAPGVATMDSGERPGCQITLKPGSEPLMPQFSVPRSITSANVPVGGGGPTSASASTSKSASASASAASASPSGGGRSACTCAAFRHHRFFIAGVPCLPQ